MTGHLDVMLVPKIAGVLIIVLILSLGFDRITGLIFLKN